MSKTLGAKALRRAIKLAGGQQKLADTVGVSQSTVAMWLKRERIPAERAVDVEAATGVSRRQLRPDLFLVA